MSLKHLRKIELEEIFEWFTFDFENGKVFRKKRHPKSRGIVVGQEAGCSYGNSGKNYWRIAFKGKSLKRSHLIFYAYYKKLPEKFIDHINRNSMDDRPSNLREADTVSNTWNRKPRAKKSLLPPGVTIDSNRFSSKISVRGKVLYLGYFATPELASEAYQKARKKYFGEFA